VNASDHSHVFHHICTSVAERHPHVVLLRIESKRCGNLGQLLSTVLEELLLHDIQTEILVLDERDDQETLIKRCCRNPMQALLSWWTDRRERVLERQGAHRAEERGAEKEEKADDERLEAKQQEHVRSSSSLRRGSLSGLATSPTVSSYQESSPETDVLAILFEDFEAISPEVAADFLTLCTNHLKTISFVILLGVATHQELAIRMFPASLTARLDVETFAFADSCSILERIIDEVCITGKQTVPGTNQDPTGDSSAAASAASAASSSLSSSSSGVTSTDLSHFRGGLTRSTTLQRGMSLGSEQKRLQELSAKQIAFKIGHTVFGLMLHLFFDLNLSLRGFSRSVEFAMMDHFLANPLSILSAPLATGFGGGVSGLQARQRRHQIFGGSSSSSVHPNRVFRDQRAVPTDDHLRLILSLKSVDARLQAMDEEERPSSLEEVRTLVLEWVIGMRRYLGNFSAVFQGLFELFSQHAKHRGKTPPKGHTVYAALLSNDPQSRKELKLWLGECTLLGDRSRLPLSSLHPWLAQWRTTLGAAWDRTAFGDEVVRIKTLLQELARAQSAVASSIHPPTAQIPMRRFFTSLSAQRTSGSSSSSSSSSSSASSSSVSSSSSSMSDALSSTADPSSTLHSSSSSNKSTTAPLFRESGMNKRLLSDRGRLMLEATKRALHERGERGKLYATDEQEEDPRNGSHLDYTSSTSSSSSSFSSASKGSISIQAFSSSSSSASSSFFSSSFSSSSSPPGLDHSPKKRQRTATHSAASSLHQPTESSLPGSCSPVSPASSKAEAAQMEQEVREGIFNFVVALLDKHLPPPNSIPLYEAFFYRDRNSFLGALNPQSRKVLHDALSSSPLLYENALQTGKHIPDRVLLPERPTHELVDAGVAFMCYKNSQFRRLSLAKWNTSFSTATCERVETEEARITRFAESLQALYWCGFIQPTQRDPSVVEKCTVGVLL